MAPHPAQDPARPPPDQRVQRRRSACPFANGGACCNDESTCPGAARSRRQPVEDARRSGGARRREQAVRDRLDVRIGAALVAGLGLVYGVGKVVLDVVTWPVWLLLGLPPLFAAAVVFKLTKSIFRGAVAGIVIALAIVAGLGVYAWLTSDGDSGERPQPPPPEEAPAILPPVGLERAPIETVFHDGVAWTLTRGGELLGLELEDSMALAPIGVAGDAARLLLCGPYLVLLRSSGFAGFRRASDGRFVHRYEFGGEAHAATCSRSTLWIVRENELLGKDELVSVAIPRANPESIGIWPFHHPVDFVLYWDERLWTLDREAGQAIAYDLRPNEQTRASLAPGVSSLLVLGGDLYAYHRRDSCLRPIDLVDRREGGPGVPLTRSPSGAASSGGSVAVADGAAPRLTLIFEAEARTYELPLESGRLTGVAIDDRWIVLRKTRPNALLVLRRADLARLEPMAARTPRACG
jgi:hypothetical protein